MDLKIINKINKFSLKILNWKIFLFQDFNSFNFKMLIYFHDLIILIILLILLIVIYMILILINNKLMRLNIFHSHLIELVWTFIPIIILLVLALPSIQILYLLEENYLFSLSIKIIGHQWYWSYEYSDFIDLGFDSFIIKLFDSKSLFRLLDVDNRLILPYNIYIRFLVSSDDVIHSWTIPSLGVKIDAIPGRLNQFMFYMLWSGLYYGQCSEICGVNHRFIPIVVERIYFKIFIDWILNN